jgi:hypothetical protein
MATPEERLMYQRGQIDYLEGNEPIDKWIRHRMKMKKMYLARFEEQQKKAQEEKEIKEKGKKIAEEVLKNLQKAFK